MTDSRPLVIHVVYGFDVGGLENCIVNLINRMNPALFRHQVLALTSCNPSFCSRVERDDVEFISLGKSPGHSIKLYPQLYRLFRRYRPSIVHTRNLAALETVLPSLAAGVAVRIHGEHGWDSFDREGTSSKYRLVRKIYSPFVTHYVALSGQIVQYVQHKVGIDSRRISRICNGVDTQRFVPGTQGREKVGGAGDFSPEHIVIGTVGRLQAVKDQITLVRAFAIARQQGASAQKLRLLIAGEGPLRGAVEDEVRTHGLEDWVTLLGERSDVPTVMRGLDVFVLPSRSEGISNTILEAMATGLPVIATNVGGSHELNAPGETGALVAAEDPQSMAHEMLRYAADVALRRSHGSAGRLRVESQFSLNGMVESYTHLYERLLQRR